MLYTGRAKPKLWGTAAKLIKMRYTVKGIRGKKKKSSIIINSRCRPIKQPFPCAHRRALTHNLPKQIHA